MRYLADLHVHSHFALATSRASTLANFAAWGAAKGLNLVGTGDFTHPGWRKELSSQLKPSETGFYRLATPPPAPALPGLTLPPSQVHFLLTSEVNCIFQHQGRTREIHCLLFAPDLDGVERLCRNLAAYGNLEADGRPTLRLAARDLLELLLEHLPGGLLIPAHIWTPWFSLFGSRSGFDSVEECFGDLSDRISALETGLSSDPAMNRCLSALDRYCLISNSDCHAPDKLGRKANIFETEFNYPALVNALRRPNPGLAGTIEFFPEEGKYYADGHRRCRYRLEPEKTSTPGCPVCGRPPTPGVRRRIAELADRSVPGFTKDSPKTYHLVPLTELLAELSGVGGTSKTVRTAYLAALNTLGPELPLLMDKPLAEIALFSEPLAQAIAQVRAGLVVRECGYDGLPGRIRLQPAGASPQPE